jgi:hypothetical protein
MANEEHLARLKHGVEAWNAWRRENFGMEPPDLSGADFSWLIPNKPERNLDPIEELATIVVDSLLSALEPHNGPTGLNLRSHVVCAICLSEKGLHQCCAVRPMVENAREIRL